MKKNNGFTLLELIIVLFLISLMTGMVTVFFANTLPSNRFNATVREFVAGIRYARSLAQVKGETETITIDLDSKKYSLPGKDARSLPAGIDVKVIDAVTGEVITGQYQMFFPAFGGAEGGTIVLSDKKRTASISLDPVVGSVAVKQLQDGY